MLKKSGKTGRCFFCLWLIFFQDSFPGYNDDVMNIKLPFPPFQICFDFYLKLEEKGDWRW